MTRIFLSHPTTTAVRYAVLIATLCLSCLNSHATPLTWFPGPSLDPPISGAATCISGGNNLLIGGDSDFSFESFPKELVATNLYWTPEATIYGVQIACGAVPNGGLIIVYGGTDGSNSLNTVIGYSPSDGQTNLTSMSIPRSYLAYAPDSSGRAYAIGGLNGSGQALSSAERYDQDVDTWAAIANLPTPRYNFPAVFDKGSHIYTFGGRTNSVSGTETATVLRYSVTANTWTNMAPMPLATAGSAAALGVDGKIYIVGGISGGVTTNVVQVYTPASNTWVISTPLPENLSASAIGVDSLGRLLVMGGMDVDGNDVGDVWRSQQLGIPDSIPVFTQYPATNGFYNVPYTSSINATGNPQPTYLLVTGPDGMLVDTYGGTITWTPQGNQIGTNSVTIRATNYVGSVDWNFTITVPPPPPTVLTNLTVLGITDTTVAFSWDPESPLAGPTSYNIYRVTVNGGKGGSHAYYTLIGTTTTNVATIGGLTVGSSHMFAVSLTAGGATNLYSQTISIKTTSPQSPPYVFLTGLTSTTLSLGWNPSPGPVQNSSYSAITSYTIAQYISGGGSYSLIPKATGIPGTNGTVTGLTPNSSAFWTVQAFDAEGYGSLPLYYVVGVSNPFPASVTVGTASLVPNVGFQIKATGASNQTAQVWATTDLSDSNSWVMIGSFLPSNNSFGFIDPDASQFSQRFYRMMQP
jgi:hypothetical protein